MERGVWRPNVDQISPSCPRCSSSNTKFCYYNNYSLTQPRYFCKGCRRYWTKGGSLRNVPVGGGCRKNRRGKSLRLSSSDVNHSRSLGYGGLAHDHVRHAYDHKGISSIDQSSSSSMISDGSHIDLAVVYANFLKPQPDCKNTNCERQESMPNCEFDPSLDQFNNSSLKLNAQLPEDQHGIINGCLTMSDLSMEAPLSDNDNFMYYCGLDITTNNKLQQDINRTQQQCSIHEMSNYALPPLPGEEIGSQELIWPDSHMMNINHGGLHLTQEEPPVPASDQTHQVPNLMFGNWSPL